MTLESLHGMGFADHCTAWGGGLFDLSRFASLDPPTALPPSYRAVSESKR